MTSEEWLALKVGDVLVDTQCRNARRMVLEVRRVTGKKGQPRGFTRTTFVVPGLRGGNNTVLNNTMDIGGRRFFPAERWMS